ncbi:MAG: aminopeptidase P family protein [Spirochaetales bacterium]|nr:aminopeptidase P family protein [Spirochaetales bacterium]
MIHKEIIRKRITSLRELMKTSGISAYIIPGTDPHQNEYIPGLWKRREWISGFTGSYGDIVITDKKAGLWTDSRYYIQAESEIDNTGITLYKLGLPDTKSINKWCEDELLPGESIGIDPALFSGERVTDLKKSLKNKTIELIFIEQNLVDRIWEEQPAFPHEKVEVHLISFCGESYQDKLMRLREKLTEEGCGFHVMTSLDSIAWLFNIRGSDIDYNPLVIAYAIVTPEKAELFMCLDKITPEVREHFGENVALHDYKDFKDHLSIHAQSGTKVWIDPKKTSYDIILHLLPACKILYKESPVIYYKAIKNTTELSCLRNAQVRDGAAMVKFLHWLEETVPAGIVTEVSAERKLAEYRQQNDLFCGLSFQTISAFGDHGAIVHYSSSEKTDRLITGNGLYLVDSGAQYKDGTTDITRTIPIGTPTDEQREMFTRVLKGHISLASAVFPKGTKGIQLDTLARKPLWDLRCDYGHGTGHGVGFFLNVHELPPSISYRNGVIRDLAPGMVCTIEPGFYKKGEYGIRIENMVTVAGNDEDDEENSFYYFKILTLCPIDTRCILPSLLTDGEKKFLNLYHRKVAETLTPLLDSDCAAWLKKAIMPV